MGKFIADVRDGKTFSLAKHYWLFLAVRYRGELDQRRQRCDQMDAAVIPDVRGQRRATPASALAYNLGNFLRTLATPEPIKDWSLTSLKEKLIKIGAKIVSHGRYVVFQMAEVAIQRQPIGGVRPNARENGQVSPSSNVRAAQGAGSRLHLARSCRKAGKA